MRRIILLAAAFIMVVTANAQNGDIIFEQLKGADAGGIVSDYYVPVESGAYSSDDFTLVAETEIGSFKFQGFGGVSDDGIEAVLAGFQLYLYEDNGGQPAGYPGGPAAAVLELDLLWDAINGPDDGLSYEKVLSTGFLPTYIITIDVQEATGNALTLSAGIYWVVIAARIDADPDDSPPRWNWTASDAMHGSLAQLTDPQSLFGLDSDWYVLNSITGSPDDPTPFNALTFTVYGPSEAGSGGDDCDQGDDSNSFENAFDIKSTSGFDIADDFWVSAGNTLNIQTISLNIISEVPINQIEFAFYEDDNGTPGDILPQSVTNIPDADHQVLIGTAFGRSVYQVYVDVNLDFEGGVNGASYWMQPKATVPVGVDNVFWEVTSVGSLGEPIHGRAVGEVWVVDEDGFHGVFKLHCEQTDPPETPPCNFNINYDIEPITRVVFSDIDNTSTATINGSAALEDFTTVVGHIQQSTPYAIALEGNTSGNYANYFSVFIDYSGEGQGEWSDFDMFEIGFMANSTGADGLQVTGTITLDESVPNGTYTMRIIKSYGADATDSPIDPCGSYNYGQAEDYTLIVGEVAAWDCPELEANIGTSCDDGDASTENDIITEGCDCVGTPVLVDGQCGFENFNNSDIEPGSSSYANGSFLGNNGVTWTYVAARDENGDINESGINGKAIMLRRNTDDSKITSSPVPGGISDFSAKLYKGFTGGGNRQAELFVNGVSQGLSETFNDYDEHIFTVTGINISGDVIIEIRNNTDKQLIVDDITWTCGQAGDYDCSLIEANFGDACDDGDASTENDVIDGDCDCVGTPIVESNCVNTSQWPNNMVTPNDDGSYTSINGCNYFGDYSGITGVVSGNEYDFSGAENTSGNIAFITVRSGSFDGDVVASGFSPLTITATSDTDLYVHWSADEDCGSGSQCASTAVTCVTCGSEPEYDCPLIPANFGDPCDDGDASTENDVIDGDCGCAGTPIVTFDCPLIEANFGDACDDLDPTTENDMIIGSCECAGTPFLNDCPDLQANFGDSCENADGEAGVIDEDCNCYVAPTYDCPGLEANVGDDCENADGGEGVIDGDCNCYVAPTYDCPELEANIGDGCENADGEEGVIDGDCNCYVAPTYDCPELEANIGDECSADGTEDNGLINAACECIVVGISDVAGFNFKMYPNPAGRNESVTLTSSQFIDRYEVLDITGKIVDARIVLNQNEIIIVLRDYSAGMYVLKAYSGSDFSTQKMVVR